MIKMTVTYHIITYYSDITWVVQLKFLATLLFVQQLVPADNKQNECHITYTL